MGSVFKTLRFKLIFVLVLCMLVSMLMFTFYEVNQVKKQTEAGLEEKARALAKSAATALKAQMEQDIKEGVISEKDLFDRNYTLKEDNSDPKKRKYTSAFDKYTDQHWQNFVDAFTADKDILFAIPVAYSGDTNTEGYLPTHNTKYKDRSKRIFNDPVGATDAKNTDPNGTKQEYHRDTGEIAWDISYPINVNGKHWGGYRVAISIDTVNANVAKKRNEIIMAMLVSILVICFIIYLFTTLIIGRPLKRIMNATKNLTSGEADLTQRLPEHDKDDLGILAQYINRFLEQIQDMVKQILSSSDEVSETSKQLAASAAEASEATQKIAGAISGVAEGNTRQAEELKNSMTTVQQLTQAIEQIATGAQEQAHNVNETSVTVGQMASAIEQVASNAQSVSDAAQQTSAAANNGSGAVDRTIKGMEEIKDKVFQAAEKIKELGEHSLQIGEIIQVIDDIAEQTNLLALNAAIEAARAGEHGKGFAVVADEVRKLAERSSKATKEIADLISNMQRGTENAVLAMEQGTVKVEEGVQLALDAGKALEEITNTVGQTYQQVQNISAAAEQISANSNDVVKAIDNVAAITEENTASTEEMAAGSDEVIKSIEQITALAQHSAASAEEVSASTEETTTLTEEMAASAHTLAENAKRLEDLVKKFKI